MMKKRCIFLGCILLGFFLISCGPAESPTHEVLRSLETSLNENDLDGIMAVFTEDAIIEFSYEGSESDYTFVHGDNEALWRDWLDGTRLGTEFRDISVDEDAATFIWAEDRGLSTIVWPTRVEIQDGKIAHLDWYGDGEQIIKGEE